MKEISNQMKTGEITFMKIKGDGKNVARHGDVDNGTANNKVQVWGISSHDKVGLDLVEPHEHIEHLVTYSLILNITVQHFIL